MTKSTITREQLLEIIETDHVQCGEASYLARMALAAMDSEPVAYIDKQWTLVYYVPPMSMGLKIGDKLYRHAQPAPVSYSDFEEFWSAYIHPLAQDDELKDFSWGIWNACVSNSQPAPVVPEEMPCGGAADDYHDGYQDGWNACRAAMLQAGTLTNEGTKQAWTGIPDIDNAINMLDRIDTLESCDDDRIEAVKTVLRGLAGNSPVIPDGYVMVPKEMTDEIGEAIAMQANCCGGIALDIYDAMIAAAPHDTPALNSVQSVVTVPDKWIPVSEQMPPSRHEVLVGRWWGEKPRWCCKWATYIPGHPDAQSSGWLIPGASWTPTHWMPLPAAPQEVKGE